MQLCALIRKQRKCKSTHYQQKVVTRISIRLSSILMESIGSPDSKGSMAGLIHQLERCKFSRHRGDEVRMALRQLLMVRSIMLHWQTATLAGSIRKPAKQQF